MQADEYRAAVQDWTDQLLAPYIDTLVGRQEGSVKVKEFNDPIWGTVGLQPEEVVVLDSPLLQRLRRIRQLGVVHLVYTSANHSRFEHSIGVCHQVGRIVDSITAHADGVGAEVESDERRLLRLTALCHDIGHGCLSHVIENALKNDRETRAIVKTFMIEQALDSTPHLSEIAAYYMIQSEGFRALIEQACRIAKIHAPAEITSHMSHIVIGKPVSDEFPLLHELISGPFDADKLDYMPRDAMMTGVPVVTDIGRLIQKVRAVRIDTDHLPESLKKQVEPVSKGHLVVGLAQSGGSTLDEVAVGRSLMFDKVYRHHKVRAAEAMVTAIVDAIGTRICEDLPILPLHIFDDEMLNLDDGEGVLGEGAATDEGEVGVDVGRRLAARDLFVRAFAFSQHLPEDPYRGEEAHRQAMDKLMRGASKADTRLHLVARIAQYVDKMVELGAVQLPAPMVGNVSRYVWVDPPASGHPDAKPDPSRAYMIGADGKAREVKQVNAEQRGWVDAYTNTHDVGYIFTPKELAVPVAIASRIACFELYDLRVPGSWTLLTKLWSGEITRLETALAEAGFFDGLAPTLRPLTSRMRKGDVNGRLEEVAVRLASVQGPSIDPSELKDSTMSADRVRDWVRQFGPDYEASALTVLENLKVLGRSETNAALASFLASETGARFRGGAVVPIGQPKDGSSVVGYHAEDAARDFGCSVLTLDQAASRDLPIVFVDDFIGRGSSTISILEDMLGAVATQELHEERPGDVPEALKDHLLSRPVAFVYSAGLDAGIEALKTRLSELGFTDIQEIHVGIHQADLPTVESALGDAAPHFMERARSVGEQLLTSTPDDKRGERTLGYGNHALLIAFPYNTPTATLTAVWERGEVDGWTWFPLLPRRKKL